jgi:hypothetical protein
MGTIYKRGTRATPRFYFQYRDGWTPDGRRRYTTHAATGARTLEDARKQLALVETRIAQGLQAFEERPAPPPETTSSEIATLMKDWKETAVGPGDLITLGRTFFLFEIDETEPVVDMDATDPSTEPTGFLTLVPSLGQKLARLRREAKRNTSITLVGETGTGKEVLAKAVHGASGRSGPYLAVNCGAIPKDLIQSELFGHAKGAFSGATEARGGYVRDAHQGTLLLDEIVAAPPPVQIALLRAIQEKAVTPVGSTKPFPVDVRFIAAAQRPLSDAVEEGTFREDLQGRLEAFVFEATAAARAARGCRNLDRFDTSVDGSCRERRCASLPSGRESHPPLRVATQHPRAGAGDRRRVGRRQQRRD